MPRRKRPFFSGLRIGCSKDAAPRSNVVPHLDLQFHLGVKHHKSEYETACAFGAMMLNDNFASTIKAHPIVVGIQADQAGYVTSDLNPGVVFIGSQLEFNSMTKYFYVDRTLPKRKLSEAEMLEINRLYRVIGRCEQQLAALLKPSAGRKTDGDEDSSPDSETGATVVRGRIPPSRLIYGGLGILGVLTLYGVYRKWGR